MRTGTSLHGYVDYVNWQRIGGWARNDLAPDVPVSLLVIADGELIARVLANSYRADLRAANNGNGRLSFEVDVAGRLSPLLRHVIEVRGEADGEHLKGSPYILEASTAFDGVMKAAMANVLGAVKTDADVEERVAFLAEQIEALLSLRDQRGSGDNQREALSKRKWLRAEPLATFAASKPRALVINDRAPVLTRDAGSVAIWSHTASLQRLGYDVSFVPADLSRDVAHLQGQGIKCLTKPWYASVEEVLARNSGAFDLVYVHRLENAEIYSLLVRRYHPDAMLVFAVADLESVRLFRQAEIEHVPELTFNARRIAAAELTACRQADLVITHSTFEADLLRKNMDPAKVHVVPFSVDARSHAVPFATRSGLAFIGSYHHSPNVDAARWLVESIMPEVHKHHPTMQCLLVGSAMPEHLKKLAGRTILPVGAVDNLATIFDRVRLTVAPLAYGAGIKGKVLQSLAAGVPCACTPAAAEGLDLPAQLKELVGRDSADLARVIIRLHEDEDFHRRCVDAGRRYIETHASDPVIDARLRAAITHTQHKTDFAGVGRRLLPNAGLPASRSFQAGYKT